jgi:hypothetical protein
MTTPRRSDVLAANSSTCLLGFYSCLVGYPKSPCSPASSVPAFSTPTSRAVRQQAAPAVLCSSFSARSRKQLLHGLRRHTGGIYPYY